MSRPPHYPLRVALRTRDGCNLQHLVAAGESVEITHPGVQRVQRAGTSVEIYEALRAVARGAPVEPVVLNPRPIRQRGEGLLLLALSAVWSELTSDRGHGRLHATLGYALPLALDPVWRRFAERNLDLLIRGRQLVTVPADDLVAVHPTGSALRKHLRLLRRHTSTTMREHRDLDAFLDAWSAFTTWRYARPLPTVEREALRAVLDASGCTVRDFIHHQEAIARSLVCLQPDTGVAFDLMTAWQPRHAGLRPGIFSAVHNMNDAVQRGMAFSLCYGQFPYKDEILGPLPRLTLDDLVQNQKVISSLS